MSYKRHFDGTYLDDDYEPVYTVSTLHNPAGFLVTDVKTGRTLTICVDDALEAIEILQKRGKKARNLVELANL